MKPVVLIFSQCYLPGYRAGGPVRTLANLVEKLGNEFEFRIVCRDRDFQGDHPYPGIRVNAWNTVGKAQVFYARAGALSWHGLRSLLRATPHDVLYLNSFFSPTFTLRPLVLRALHQVPRRPVVLAPRGEFSGGALALKAFRKRAFITVANAIRLYADAHWQASSELEAQDIARHFTVPASRLHEARNLVSGAPSDVSVEPGRPRPTHKGDRPLRACFLSRISPMKGLEFALEALARVSTPTCFSIYGPVEDAAYWTRCQERIRSLPANVEVIYEGPVTPENVSATLARHDLFLFPTRGENFGHVIYEALRAGLVLLVSDQTPWQQLEARGVGWDLPLSDQDAFAERIERVATATDAQRRRWSERARALAAHVSQDADAVEANRRMFRDVIAAAARPHERAAFLQGEHRAR